MRHDFQGVVPEEPADVLVAKRGDECLHGSEIQIDDVIDLGIRVAIHKHVFHIFPPQAAMLDEITNHRFARFHDGSQRIALDGHIREHRLLLERKFREAGPGEFHHLPCEHARALAFVGEMEDHIFCGT